MAFPVCNAIDYHVGGAYCDSVGQLIGGTDEACGLIGPANADLQISSSTQMSDIQISGRVHLSPANTTIVVPTSSA
jgi:hypothetical protein